MRCHRTTRKGRPCPIDAGYRHLVTGKLACHVHADRRASDKLGKRASHQGRRVCGLPTPTCGYGLGAVVKLAREDGSHWRMGIVEVMGRATHAIRLHPELTLITVPTGRVSTAAP